MSMLIVPGNLSDAMIRVEGSLAMERGDDALLATCLLALGVLWEEVPGGLQVMRFPGDADIETARQRVCDSINAREGRKDIP